MQHPIQIDTYIILVAKYTGETVHPKAGYGKKVFEYTYPLRDYTSKT